MPTPEIERLLRGGQPFEPAWAAKQVIAMWQSGEDRPRIVPYLKSLTPMQAASIAARVSIWLFEDSVMDQSDFMVLLDGYAV